MNESIQTDDMRVLFANVVLHYCEPIESSLHGLSEDALPDGTSATRKAESIHKDVLKLCEKLRVLETLSCSMRLEDRFEDRFAICVREIWQRIRIRLQEWLKEYGKISTLVLVKNGSNPPSTRKQIEKKEADSAKLLTHLQTICLEFLNYQKTIRSAASAVSTFAHDGELELGILTKFLLKSDVDGFDYSACTTDYYVTEAEFALGLGASERYLANTPREGFPAPLVEEKSKLYSLKALHGWYRGCKVHGKRKRKFDPIRVPKKWYRVSPNGTTDLRIDEPHD